MILLVAALFLSLHPAPSAAPATPKTTTAHKHQRNAHKRSPEFSQSDRRRLIEQGRLLEANPNADACLSYGGDYISQSKACPKHVHH